MQVQDIFIIPESSVGHKGQKRNEKPDSCGGWKLSKKPSTRQRLLNDSISAGEQGSGMGQV